LRKFRTKIKAGIILPESLFSTIWTTLITVVIIYLSIEIPLELIFHYEIPDWLKFSNIIITLIFMVDIFLNFRTAYYHDGRLIMDKLKIRKYYLKGNFFIDFIATIPFEPILMLMGLGAWGSASSSLRFLRLLRLLRLFRISSVLKAKSPLIEKPIFVTIFQYTTFSFLASHGIACGWLSVNGLNLEEDNFTNYVHSMYWTVTTLTTVGYGDVTPADNIGKLYTMLVMILGVGMYGFIIGNISSLLVKVDADREEQREKMAELVAFMTRNEVPKDLRDEVICFYIHFLTVRSGKLKETVMRELPDPLRDQLELYVSLKMINMVPFFRPLGTKCKEALSKVLEPLVVGPDKYVIKEGDIGKEMYFVGHGLLQVFVENVGDIAEIDRGSFFGEMALMEETPRTASVKSLTYCNLYKLDKDNFLKIMDEFEELSEKINEVRLSRS